MRLFALILVFFIFNCERGSHLVVKNFEDDVNSIRLALEIYKMDCGNYPPSLKSLLKNFSRQDCWGGPYIDQIPEDEWGREFRFEVDKEKMLLKIFSLGEDGRLGGDGDNADLVKFFPVD